MNDNVNQAIQCTVTSCAHHCKNQDYCSLQGIKVGCQESAVSKCGQTECASFNLGDHGTSCCK